MTSQDNIQENLDSASWPSSIELVYGDKYKESPTMTVCIDTEPPPQAAYIKTDDSNVLLRYLYKRLHHILPLEELAEEWHETAHSSLTNEYMSTMTTTNTTESSITTTTTNTTTNSGSSVDTRGGALEGVLGSSTATMAASRSTSDDPYRLDELLKMHHMEASP